MNAYTSLASSYDRLTEDVSYSDILEYIKNLFTRFHKNPSSVLDLACGTGSLSILLAQAGYQVLGVDMSEDMLTIASGKAYESELENRPYFIRQKMQNLRLPYAVDAVVCCLDSLNYLLNPEDLKKTFRSVYRSLEPGGIFVFDLNTPAKFHAMDGQIFLDEDDDVYCVWRAVLDPADNIMTYGMDIFTRNGLAWRRDQEEHKEYVYDISAVLEFLKEAGFSDLALYGDRTFLCPDENEQRVYIAACKGV